MHEFSFVRYMYSYKIANVILRHITSDIKFTSFLEIQNLLWVYLFQAFCNLRYFIPILRSLLIYSQEVFVYASSSLYLSNVCLCIYYSISPLSNVRRSVHSPQDHFIITFIISDRRDWRDTRGKWLLARNPDRSWWHRHTNWKCFWPQSMAPWTTGTSLRTFILRNK